jgi:diketogulonate reductase-like aldo/keto reductase
MSASGSNFSRRTLIKSGVYATVGLAIARAGLAEAADSLPLITKMVPSTKEKLPVIGIGTNAYGVTDPAELAARREVLKRLPELGGSIVDTAQAYGTSEQVIGDAVAALGNRSKLFIATKTPLAGNVSDAKMTLRRQRVRREDDAGKVLRAAQDGQDRPPADP